MQASVNCAIRKIPGSLLRLARNFVRAFLRARAWPEMPADGRTTITNASRRACTRACTRASACTRLGAAPFLLVAARGGCRSSNSREIQNKRSRRLRAIATGCRDRVGGPTRPRPHYGACTLLAVYPETTGKPPAHARRGLTSLELRLVFSVWLKKLTK